MSSFDFKTYKADVLNPILISLRSMIAGRPIAVWGCGVDGKHVLKFLNENDLVPECFLDSSREMQGQLMADKYPIVSPVRILEAKTHFILVASTKYCQEMVSELQQNGLKKDVDYFCFSNSMFLLSSGNVINSHKGYCPICEKETVFIEMGAWLRDDYQCLYCGSIPRMRSLVRTLNRFTPNWRELTIHESSSAALFIDFFSERCEGYSYSEFFPNITPGSYHNGIRCENLERLTFQDNSIDIFITQDVLEHVMNPQLAFSEIERVLKPGGYHIFTVPIYERNTETIQRARMNEDEIEYLEEPEFHGPYLVTYHHNLDIIEKIGSNMLTTIILEKNRDFGIDGEFLHIFACKKLR